MFDAKHFCLLGLNLSDQFSLSLLSSVLSFSLSFFLFLFYFCFLYITLYLSFLSNPYTLIIQSGQLSWWHVGLGSGRSEFRIPETCLVLIRKILNDDEKTTCLRWELNCRPVRCLASMLTVRSWHLPFQRKNTPCPNSQSKFLIYSLAALSLSI